MLASIAVVIAAVLAGGWLYSNKGGAEEVLVIARPVEAGRVITEDDVRGATQPLFEARSVSGVEGAILVADVDSVFGQRTTVPLLPGQVLTSQALTSELLPADGDRLIAVNLPAGRVPATLDAGSVVDAVAVPQEGQAGDGDQLDDPAVIASGAAVHSLRESPDGTVVVTLLIAEADARAVSAYGAVGQLVLIQAPVTEGDADAVTPGLDDESSTDLGSDPSAPGTDAGEQG